MVDLVVEDGTGKEDANSYASIEQADTYFESRGVTAWTSISGDADEKKIALIKATSYLDNRYRGRWHGARSNETQALAWPRSDVLDGDGFEVAEDKVPTLVLYATMEAAKRALSGELYADWSPSAPGITSESKSVGPLSKSVSYATPVAGKQPIFMEIDDLLYDITRSRRTIFLQRA